MRVFVLTTGRTGSVTFSKACAHISNFTSGHETRFYEMGADRVDYQDQHIEADCRLSFFLGRLTNAHPDAYYVHMVRDPSEVAASFTKCYMRSPSIESIVAAWGMSIAPKTRGEYYTAALDYVTATRDNITEFLRGRDHMLFSVSDPEDMFREFWNRIGAEGDIDAALAEFSVKHNAGPED